MKARALREPARELSVRADCDVAVIGGGPAGIAAAIAAAREGARTILIERYGALGGLATGGLIILLLTMDDGEGHPVIAGICQEVIDRLAELDACVQPPREQWGSREPGAVEAWSRWGLVWGRSPAVVRYAVAYDPEALRAVANELVLAAGVELLLHAWGARALTTGDRIDAIAVESKSGREAIVAKVYVDATGDGDVFASAGAAFESERVHPWLWFRMAGVDDPDAAVRAAGHGVFKTPPGTGRILAPWGAAGRISRQISAVDVADLTFAEIECRRMVMAEVDRLRREAPGFENAFLTDIASQLGITESRRLAGVCTLGRDEANQRHRDVVARTGNWTKAGMVYDIPYGSLISPTVGNLVVAGRCISVDHRVHHSTKEIPACFATGQAAGIAAAITARTGGDVRGVAVPQIQRALLARGAILDLT